MKTKNKFIAIVVCIAMLATLLSACNPVDNGGGTFTPPVDDDPTVTELIIVSPPTKTDYKAGQVFDPAGMKLLAKWSHGVDEDLSPGECKRDPKGPLEVGTTGITFTYEGASCTQPITVSDVAITDVVFDFSAINSLQRLGIIDLTAISVVAKYADDSEETVTNVLYEMYENDEKIADPSRYSVKSGSHTITVKYLTYSDSFTFAALYGYNVPIAIVEGEEKVLEKIEGKENFLEKPQGGGNYALIGDYLGEVTQDSVMRFHIYSELETQAELVMNLASARLLKGGWEDPREMGEVQFSKAFEVNNVKTDRMTGMPELDNGNEVKTNLALDDSAILPGSLSPQGDVKLLKNYVDVSFGEITLAEGYNIIEVKVKDCDEYKDGWGTVRTANIKAFEVRALNSDEHDHAPVKVNGSAATCTHYGSQEYYRCSVCARIFSDEEMTERIYNPLLIQPDPEKHEWDREHADCMHDKVCIEDGTIGETRTPHTFEHDLCTYDGEQECSVCHNTFKGGHRKQEINGTIQCTQCSDIFGYKVQAEDTAKVMYSGQSHSQSDTGTDGWSNNVFNGADGGISIGNLEGDAWNTGNDYIEIKVNVDAAGTYALLARMSSNTGSGSNDDMELAQIFEVGVKRGDEAVTYTTARGKAVAASKVGGWSRLYYWGITEIANVQLDAGENTVVLKKINGRDYKDGRAPCFDYFVFEPQGVDRTTDAETVATRSGGNVFSVGENATPFDVILPGVYVRIAVPQNELESVGAIYYDEVVTKEMCDTAGFSTATAGEYTVTFTVEKFGNTYSADFTYIVR